VGPDHWRLIAPQYGWSTHKAAHSLWLGIGAEMGFVGLSLLLAFYGLCVWGAWQMLRSDHDVNSWFAGSGRMVIASLSGFAASACFVSLEGLELPYFIVLLGAGAMKLHEQAMLEREFAADFLLPTNTFTTCL